jgi:hypothetical protein
MNPRPLLSRRSVLGCALGLAAGCAPGALVPIAGKSVDAATIDEDPYALLPPGIVVFGNLDARALFATSIGADVAGLVASVVPLGQESNFNPVRDVARVVGGVYAMQGVDFCAVVRGTFDVAAISAAASARVAAPGGYPVVRTRYGPYDLYTVGNIGFVLLTPSTMLSGNETGMRRALDRLRYNKLARTIPAWMISLAESAGTVFGIAGDFGAVSAPAMGENGLLTTAPLATSAAQPVLEAAAKNFPFLSELRAMRVVGNFQDPGMNLAGALTYTTAERAENGASGLKNLAQMASFAGLVSSLGFGPSIPPMKIAISGSDVGFTQPIDTGFARYLLNFVGGSLRR